MEKIENYIHTHYDHFIDTLKTFLRFDSVSTDPTFKPSVDACSEWVHAHLTQMGFPIVTTYPTQGHPIVYAEWIVDPSKPTVMCYGHYDVQPAEPYDLWITPPFEPTIRNGHIVARGASDDKGQVMCHLNAIESIIKTEGAPPVNIKILIEGEEEIGSANLYQWVLEHKDLLKADILFVSDTPMISEEQPSLSIGLRGLIYFEVTLTTANTDLHSGQHGGAVPNAITELVTLLSKLKHPDGSIAVPHVYDHVRPISPELKTHLSKIPHSDADYQAELGTTACPGEPGFSSLERRWFRPTLDINGIWGGYTSAGAKTVIPCKASAKLSMRLVHDQNPKEITTLLTTYITQLAPPHTKIAIKDIKANYPSTPYLADISHPIIHAAKTAITYGFNTAPVLQGEGGSIPIVSFMQTHLGLTPVLMGFNLPYDNIHAPNEQFSLTRFKKGILSTAYFLKNLPGLSHGG